MSELLHAVQRRNERDQFCIFVDEFENYASFEDFSTLITQAPKLGIATTIAHHERYGQLNQDPAILGATAAIANKVLFQITPRDAQELAVEFAQKPPVERRFEQEYVISQEPVRDLLRGHHRPQVREFVDTYLRSLLEKREDIKEQMEGLRIERQLALDQAGLGRIDERMLDLEGRDSSYIAARRRSLDAAGQALEVAQLKSLELLLLFESGNSARLAVRKINKFLSATMRGILPGQEAFSTLLLDCIHETRLVPDKYREVLALYIFLSYGDQAAARCVPVRLAQKYGLLPQAMEAIHRVHEEKTRNDMRKEWKALWDGYEQGRAKYIEDRERKKREVAAGVRKKVTAWRYDTHWAMYHCTVRLIMAYILHLEYKAARDVLGPYQSVLFSHSWLGNIKEHNYWYGTVSEWIKEVKREIAVFRNDKKRAVKYKRNYERERMGFVWFGWVAPYTGDDNMYYGPYFQGFLLDSFEAYLNRYGEGALVALSLICQAQEPNLWGDVVSVAENEDLKWGETK